MKIISLFSGAGGLDLGLIQAGHKVIWANDIASDAVETYRKNIGNHIVLGDIDKIDIDEIPDGDVVVGGFPCQGFSLANLNRSADDERNKLYLYFLRIVYKKQPLYFLAENVKGILSLDNGKAIQKIMSDFTKAGYRVKYRLFNTADYGVPQTRQRVIIAGTRCDLPEELDYQYPNPTHSIKANGLKGWVTSSEALKDIPEPDDNLMLPNHIFSKYKVTDRNFIGHRRTDPNKPSPTVLAKASGVGGVVAVMHPDNHRRMSIRESAIIQSFPLDFKFEGKMNSCYRQVGNAVPVLFAKHLGEQLRILEKKNKK